MQKIQLPNLEISAKGSISPFVIIKVSKETEKTYIVLLVRTFPASHGFV